MAILGVPVVVQQLDLFILAAWAGQTPGRRGQLGQPAIPNRDMVAR
jgi:hypothetical protein